MHQLGVSPRRNPSPARLAHRDRHTAALVSILGAGLGRACASHQHGRLVSFSLIGQDANYSMSPDICQDPRDPVLPEAYTSLERMSTL